MNEDTLQQVQDLLEDGKPKPELHARLERLHAADIAALLEALPLEERLAVWNLVKADRDGEILVEVSDAVRESLIEAMKARGIIVRAASQSGVAEEAGFAYKDLAEVVDVVHRLDISRKVVSLRPIGNLKG